MPASTQDPLVAATDRLRQALGRGPEEDHANITVLDDALAHVEDAICQQGNIIGRVGEPVVEMDRPLLPSPGVDRRQRELRAELAQLLRDVRALHDELKSAAALPMLGPDATCLSGSEVAAIGTDFQQRASAVAERLAQFKKEEIDFVQKSVTVDIGAGD